MILLHEVCTSICSDYKIKRKRLISDACLFPSVVCVVDSCTVRFWKMRMMTDDEDLREATKREGGEGVNQRSWKERHNYNLSAVD